MTDPTTHLTDTYAATEHLPAFLKQQARMQVFRDAPQTVAGGLIPLAGSDTTYLGRIWTPAGDFERRATQEGAERAAQATRWAGAGEVFGDAFAHNVTGVIADWFRREEDDPGWKMDKEQSNWLLGQPKELADFVAGARSQAEFERRRAIALERKDLFERMENTAGWRSWRNAGAGLLAGLTDPVAVGASVLTGGAVAAARAGGLAARMAAANASRARWMVRGAQAGAAENMLAEAFIQHMDNQDLHWGTMVGQGIFGAGLGAMGGLLARRAAQRQHGTEMYQAFLADELQASLAREVQDALQSRLDMAWRHGQGEPYIFGETALLPADMTEMPRVHKTVSLPVGELTPTARAIGNVLGNPRQPLFAADLPSWRAALDTGPRPRADVPPERHGPQQAGQSAVGAGRVPQVRRLYTGGEGNQVARFSKGAGGAGDFAPIAHARYQEFRKSGLIEEVRARDLDGLPADAKAVYVPADGKVYFIRDRLTAADAADPTGLIAHEVGVHYGLERLLGSQRYAQVLDEVERLAKTDPRVRDALSAVPKDTPSGLVLEEALGYFAEKNTALGPLARLMAGIRAWLREHVPLFKNMGMTGNDLIRLVEGAVEAARRAEVRATESLTDAGLPRYSRGAEEEGVELRKAVKAQEISEAAARWDEKVAPAGEHQQRFLRWYYQQRDKALADGAQPWVDSPGLSLAKSNSRVARYLGAQLFESATGLGKRMSSVAVEYEQLQMAYKHQAIPKLKAALVRGMTAREQAAYLAGGAKEATARVWREVITEGQKRRQAEQAKIAYESTAPRYVRDAAQALDDFFDEVSADGVQAGNPMAALVRGGGVVGHIPYEWQWEKIARAYREDPARFRAFHDLLTRQYTERIVDPAVAELATRGEATAEDLLALRDRMQERVKHMVDNKAAVLMQDPKTRLDGMAQRFEIIAADLLGEDFAGVQVTPEVIQTFRDRLGDVRRDRSRTELDLLREVNGVSLLDFMQTDALTIVTHAAHRWAGWNALARKGFTELEHAQAARQAALLDGATPQELEAVDFGFRSFGLGQLRNHERAAFSTVRNFTYAAMMGKLGLNVLADLASVVTATGLRGFFATIGHAAMPETALVKQLAVDAPGLLGQDYRLVSPTPDASATGRVMTGTGGYVHRASQRAAQAVSYISFANTASRMLHKGFLPVFTEDVLRTVRGENGGVSTARLADIGIDAAQMGRIKAQLDLFDADRQRGGRINWDAWADQGAADDLKTALHRGTWQVFQRAMVGEQPMWMTETAMGALISQFRRYGVISAEKQVMRNAAIGDGDAAVALAVGLTWGAMLYAARLQAATAGMSGKETKEYMARNASGWRAVTGILNLTNASGILPEGVALGELLFGGTHSSQNRSPIAGVGYLTNLAGALNQLGSYATGQGAGDKAVRAVTRILPGANSFAGTALMNAVMREGW